MAVHAILREGRKRVELAARYETITDVLTEVDQHMAKALTGSAMPDVWLDTAAGGHVRYADVMHLDPK